MTGPAAVRRARGNIGLDENEKGRAMSANYEVRGAVAVITIDNPPVNSMGFATRKALVAALEQARADAAVKAVVLIGTGKVFCGGADITEFGSGNNMAEPNLPGIINQIEAFPKPVIAAINGLALGGGNEL